MERLLTTSLTTILKRIFEIRKEKKNNIYEFILNILFKIIFNDLLLTKGSNNFKEVTTITERLLTTSLTTILKRIFEIRKENNIYELILNILFKIVFNDVLNNLSMMVMTSLKLLEPCKKEIIEYDLEENI